MAAGMVYGGTWVKAGGKAVQYGGKFALNAYKRVTNFFSAAKTSKLAMETKNVVKLAQEATHVTQKVMQTTVNSNAMNAAKTYVNTLSEVDFKRHLKYCKRKGNESIKLLGSGRLRYYNEIKPPRTLGDMKGSRYVHEFNTQNGLSRGWYETLDNNNKIRQVRPEFRSNEKKHYFFDTKGDLQKIW
jgi:hypothetical protein